MIPVLVGLIVDRAIEPGDVTALLSWVAVLFVDVLLVGVCLRYGALYGERADVGAERWSRMLVAERVLRADGGAERARLPGDLTSVAVSDAKRVGVLNAALPRGVAALVTLAVVAFVLFDISVPLGLLILLGSPPLVAAVSVLGIPLQRRSGPEQQHAAHAAGVSADLLQGIRVLKGIGAEATAVSRYVDASRAALGATMSAARAQAWYSGAVLVLNGLFLAVVALVGGRLAMTGSITVGELVTAVGLAQLLLGPLQMIGWVNGRLAQARASAARIADVRSAAPGVVSGGDAGRPTGPGRLRISGLTTGALRGLSLTVDPGEVVGLVHPDPAAATALAQVLGRERDPEAGYVALDGVDLRALALPVARAAVLVAAHDARLFAGTVHDNVAAGRPPHDGIAVSGRAAQVDQVAEVLPRGLDTPVTEQGRSLSGGQRQRIALARALAVSAADDSAVLVLHDPTTALDTVTEARIAEALPVTVAGRATLMITTSPTLLGITDRVVFLGAGRSRAGTHRELLRDDPAYRDLVRS